MSSKVFNVNLQLTREELTSLSESTKVQMLDASDVEYAVNKFVKHELLKAQVKQIANKISERKR